MTTIWKYTLKTTDAQTISMPANARILSLQTQFGIPCLWVMVDPAAAPEPRQFFTYGTGHKIIEPISNLQFVGSYQLDGGALVFHVFETAS